METKYGKYLITELKPKAARGSWEPEYREDEIKQVLYLDSNVLRGAFYVDTAWFFPGLAKRDESQDTIKPHSHDYNEVQAVFGTDPGNPHDLGGELEFWLGDEKQIITRSCLIFIPGGLRHGPIYWRKIERPIFHFVCGTTEKPF
jgi:hypothetical protein